MGLAQLLNKIGFENSEIDRIFSELQLLDLGIPMTVLARECHCSPASI